MSGSIRRSFAAFVGTTALVLSSAVATTGARQGSASPWTLDDGVGHRRHLASGQTHTYDVALSDGEFLHLTVEQLAADIVLEFAGPAGQRFRVNSLADSFPAEEIVVIAEATGTHRLEIASTSASPSGGYRIRIQARRPATPADRDHARAERLFEAARRGASGTPADRGSAEAFAGALSSYQQIGIVGGEMKALWGLGMVQHALGMPEARATMQQALTRARALGDAGSIAGVLSGLGNVLEGQDASRDAGDAYHEAAAIYQRLGNRKWEANALNSIGIGLRRLGEAERGIDYQKRALVLAEEVNATTVQRDTLNNLGIAYKDLGEFRTSLDFYQRSLAASKLLEQPANEAGTLNNLGNLHRLMGEHTTALALHTDALAISQRLQDNDNVARSLNTIGLTHYQLGDYRQALAHHEEALAIRRSRHDLSGQASSLDGAGRAWHKLGDAAKARDALEEALRIRVAIHDRYVEPDTLLALASVKRDTGDLPGALRDIEAAVDLTDALRGRVMSPELRASFVAAEQDRYELYVDLLMQLHRTDAGAGYASRALEASERGRARLLIESLLEARLDLRRDIDPVLLDRERDAQRRLAAASARLSSLVSRHSVPSAIDDARAAIEEATVALREVSARIRQESPDYAALSQPRPLTTGAIQQSLLDADTLLLEFALGDTRSWLWVVSPTAVDSVELPARAEIEAAARQFYRALTARQPIAGESRALRAERIRTADAEWRRQANDLGRMLLGTAVSRLGEAWRGKRLLIVAAEALDYVPFSTIHDPAYQDRLLIEDHEIVNLPSATVLATIRQQTAAREPGTRTLAVLADPVFAIDDPRVGQARMDAPVDTALVSRALRSTRGTGASGAYQLPRLPFSRDEARAIAALVPAGERLEATGFAASRALVTSGDLGAYRLVHFATHGFLNSEHPDLSGLVLSLVGPDGAAHDGFLRLNDIYNLRLTADVVVLSACQTALGKEIRGEGLVGLTRGFMYAGARRVVASLWQVDDLATAELMGRFYRGMLRDGLRPAAALRAAQRQLAAETRWASPFFWSGFTLQGEWQ